MAAAFSAATTLIIHQGSSYRLKRREHPSLADKENQAARKLQVPFPAADTGIEAQGDR